MLTLSRDRADGSHYAMLTLIRDRADGSHRNKE